jgi:hypothetical protein
MLGAQPCMQTAGNNTTQREGYIDRETYIYLYAIGEKLIPCWAGCLSVRDDPCQPPYISSSYS